MQVKTRARVRRPKMNQKSAKVLRVISPNLVGAFEKSLQESNLHQESSSLLIQRLKNYTRICTCNNPHNKNRSKITTLGTKMLSS
jgi:hypothetical protein